ncbi:cadmium transporter [Bifidobacterium platyrrhinorum]|uniref:Cadmium transporter n=1 Tax=Bifidobacterium platyrrhinorum TaxID=2661628 RepID=A0A6L9SVZ5_9BIFI|nr:cadmium transporter [Bifidobacterium platyrrhinorum]NEG55712.1 cadmium transporter [Bifidobacterium platyrrhinorum]
MPSSWTHVDKDTTTGLPIMLAQNIIVGAALTVGAIACSGFYLTMIGNVASLVPWALVVTFVAVAYTYVVGFAILWCVESFTLRMRDKFKPVAYGVIGAIGYGVWGLFVMTSVMNSLDQPLNGVVLSNGDVVAITVNYAVFGFIATMLGQAHATKLAARSKTAIGLLVAQIALAALGLVCAVMMFSALGR